MGNFLAKVLNQLKVGDKFIMSNGLGDKETGVIEAEAKGGLVPVVLDGREEVQWFPEDEEVVIEA